MVDSRRLAWRPAVLATALVVAGGVAAQCLRIPLPWMVGPMLAMIVAKLLSLDVTAPAGGRQAGQLIIGVAIGLYFTPQVLAEVAYLIPVMLPMGLLSILVGYLSAQVLIYFTGADKGTAFFASVPGGAAEMVILGRRYGGDAEFVAMSQSLRMMLVVLVIPIALTVAGDSSGAARGSLIAAQVDAQGLMLLLAINIIAAWVFRWLSLPTPWMLAPLVCTAVLTASGAQFSGLPTGFSALGQALIGCAIGAQFNRPFLIRAPGLVVGMLMSTLATLILSALIAVVVSWAVDLPMSTMILAMAPGGIAEMAVTAKVLGLGVPIVTAFHVFRLVVLLMSTSGAFRIGMYLSARQSVNKCR